MSSRPEILATWDGQSLRATGWADRDAIKAYPPGTTFSLRRWEQGAQAARGFVTKFIEIAAENAAGFITADRLKADIKRAGGFIVGEQTEVDGSKQDRLQPVGKMSREELTRFTEFAKDYVVIELSMDAETIAVEAMNRIKPRSARS